MTKPRTEYMRLDDYLSMFHPRNPKSHDVGAIIESIQRFGFVEQPTVDENTNYIVAGHGRGVALNMMLKQGMECPERIELDTDDMWMLPVMRGIHFKDEAHVNAYLIASNRLTMLGGWDEPKLAEMLQELALEFDELLQSTAFDEHDLNELLRDLALPDDFREYDESVENEVEYMTCPHCGEEFPK